MLLVASVCLLVSNIEWIAMGIYEEVQGVHKEELTKLW